MTLAGVTYTAFESAKVTLESPANKMLVATAGDAHIGDTGSNTLASLSASAKTEGNLLTGTDGDDFITGTNAADHILAGAGNDRIVGGKGNDIIDGGAGHDIVEMTGKVTDYTFLKDADGTIHASSAAEGQDILHNVEALYFAGSAEMVPVDHVPG